METRDRATGSSVLVQGFQLALEVEGLRPRTVNNYVRDIGSRKPSENHEWPIDLCQ